MSTGRAAVPAMPWRAWAAIEAIAARRSSRSTAEPGVLQVRVALVQIRNRLGSVGPPCHLIPKHCSRFFGSHACSFHEFPGETSRLPTEKNV